MAAPRTELLRKLRVAFTVAELNALQAQAAFDEALRKCDGSPASVREMVRLGGSLLTEKGKTSSTLTPKPRRDAA